jgi:F-type H+-transporting ATPase subunit epsilon
MAKTFRLYITTPEKSFYDNQVECLVLTTTDGEIGILPGHITMVVALTPAPIRIQVPDAPEWLTAAIIGGFARISDEDVRIFADTAEWPEEIEYNRALEAKQRAEKRLQAHVNEVEYLRSQVALQRALVRLNVKQGRK